MTDPKKAGTDDRSGNGRLFVVSAPSGAGKTTLCEAARKQLPNLVYSVSSTTRPPRKGETEGIDYFFVSETDFIQGIDDDLWLEWAKVHDNYYGTSSRFVRQQLKEGYNVLLDIDVQGAAQIVKRYPEVVTIFIMAPSLEDLRSRLVKRGLDSDTVIEKRLKSAEREIACRQMYRYTVVNEDLESAIAEFVTIIRGEVDDSAVKGEKEENDEQRS